MEHLSSVLYALYRGQPAHREWVTACLEGAWAAILGDTLARKCRPASFDDGTLTVEIIDEAWEAALREVRDDLRERISKATSGEVRRVVLAPPASQFPDGVRR